jgi:hypothetical protein
MNKQAKRSVEKSGNICQNTQRNIQEELKIFFRVFEMSVTTVTE